MSSGTSLLAIKDSSTFKSFSSSSGSFPSSPSSFFYRSIYFRAYQQTEGKCVYFPPSPLIDPLNFGPILSLYLRIFFPFDLMLFFLRTVFFIKRRTLYLSCSLVDWTSNSCINFFDLTIPGDRCLIIFGNIYWIGNPFCSLLIR